MGAQDTTSRKVKKKTGPKPGTGFRAVPRERLDKVAAMMLDMVPYQAIIGECAAEFNCERSTIQRYITMVHKEWAADAQLTAPTRRHQVRGAMETHFQKLLDKKDYKTAAYMLRQMGLFDGCYADQKIEIHQTGQVGVGISLAPLGFKSPEDVRARINEIQEMIKSGRLDALTGGKSSQVPLNILATGKVRDEKP